MDTEWCSSLRKTNYGICEAWLFQTGCPSSRSTTGIKAVKGRILVTVNLTVIATITKTLCNQPELSQLHYSPALCQDSKCLTAHRNRDRNSVDQFFRAVELKNKNTKPTTVNMRQDQIQYALHLRFSMFADTVRIINACIIIIIIIKTKCMHSFNNYLNKECVLVPVK